jgi:hypothetical protein
MCKNTGLCWFAKDRKFFLFHLTTHVQISIFVQQLDHPYPVIPVNPVGEEPGILAGRYHRKTMIQVKPTMHEFFVSSRPGAFFMRLSFKVLTSGKAFAKGVVKQYNMKMKSLTLTAIVLFAGLASQAQKAQLRGGINLANISVTDNGRVDQANQITSFQAGILTDIPLGSKFLVLQPGLLYTSKGAKVQKGSSGQAGYYKQTFNPRYLELPLTLLVKAPIGSGSRFYAGAGPYIAAGIGGNVKTEGTLPITGNYSYTRDITFSNDDPTTFNQEEGTGLGVVRRFDYGLNGTVGIEGKTMVLGATYGLGLAKLQSGTNNSADNNNKNRVLSVTLGFKF